MDIEVRTLRLFGLSFSSVLGCKHPICCGLLGYLEPSGSLLRTPEGPIYFTPLVYRIWYGYSIWCRVYGTGYRVRGI